jgi:Tol biopolymer transport system component
MKRLVTCILAAIVMASVTPTAQEPERLFKVAMNTELVDGDLRAAIEQYKKVVEGGNRALAAQALVRMAECYRKLGDAQARTIYEQVLRDYADQAGPVQVARAQLATGNPAGHPGDITLRKLWAGNYHVSSPAWRQLGTVSADGHRLSYSDQPDDTLFLHDLRDGTSRPLTERTAADQGVSQQSAISRDGSQIVFNWLPDTAGNVWCELRIASLKDTGIPSARRLFGDEDVTYMTPMDWSPDAKQIAVTLLRRDRTNQIGLVSVQDGSLRVLKSVDWRGPTGLFFSPDGRDLVYDLPAGDETDQRDVFVLATDGSREVPVVTHPATDIAMGWSPDGRYLVFASDRSGSNDLWVLPFAQRRPAGPAEMVKANIGNAWSMGVTGGGAIYMGVHGGDRDVEVAPIDFEAGKGGVATKPIQRFTGTNDNPEWSPDGKSLAYVSGRGPDGHLVIAIRSIETGETRELQTKPVLPWFVGLSWRPDGRSFTVLGTDLKGRDGIFNVDAQTGQVTPVVIPIPLSERPTYQGFFWSRDQKRLYYQRQNGTILERDIASGSDRVIVPQSSPADRRCGQMSLSPDGRTIATCRANTSTDSQALVLIPVDGGERRELLRVTYPQVFTDNTSSSISWMPDGRGLIVGRATAPPKSVSSANMFAGPTMTELWLVSTTGSAPRKLAFDAERAERIRVNPNGRQLAFVSGRRHAEIWVLEHFLPAAARQTARK